MMPESFGRPHPTPSPHQGERRGEGKRGGEEKKEERQRGEKREKRRSAEKRRKKERREEREGDRRQGQEGAREGKRGKEGVWGGGGVPPTQTHTLREFSTPLPEQFISAAICHTSKRAADPFSDGRGADARPGAGEGGGRGGAVFTVTLSTNIPDFPFGDGVSRKERNKKKGKEMLGIRYFVLYPHKFLNDGTGRKLQRAINALGCNNNIQEKK